MEGGAGVWKVNVDVVGGGKGLGISVVGVAGVANTVIGVTMTERGEDVCAVAVLSASAADTAPGGGFVGANSSNCFRRFTKSRNSAEAGSFARAADSWQSSGCR